MAVAVAALLALTTVVLQLGSAVAARHRAQNAADSAALAGALAAWAGTDTACANARRLAEANRVALVGCGTTGVDVQVTVAAPVRIGPAAAQATARGRAGPIAAGAPG